MPSFDARRRSRLGSVGHSVEASSPDGAKRNPGLHPRARDPGLRGAFHRAGHFGPDPLAPSGLRLLRPGYACSSALGNAPSRHLMLRLFFHCVHDAHQRRAAEPWW